MDNLFCKIIVSTHPLSRHPLHATNADAAGHISRAPTAAAGAAPPARAGPPSRPPRRTGPGRALHRIPSVELIGATPHGSGSRELVGERSQVVVLYTTSLHRGAAHVRGLHRGARGFCVAMDERACPRTPREPAPSRSRSYSSVAASSAARTRCGSSARPASFGARPLPKFTVAVMAVAVDVPIQLLRSGRQLHELLLKSAAPPASRTTPSSPPSLSPETILACSCVLRHRPWRGQRRSRASVHGKGGGGAGLVRGTSLSTWEAWHMQVRPQLGKHQSAATPACDRDSHAQSENTDHGSGKIEDQRSWLSGHRLATIVYYLPISRGTCTACRSLGISSGDRPWICRSPGSS
ncbi:hypothetical protein SORBI_3004G354800 [Sorghum bicolor]|uniref:Uncharacterized protein n=1 Tax=Sorghum bicolor TaxID=4558 RepID=A0A194YTA5_SORBI|nr:hypothetical protein SORBI_3004G354800 [Sorghum bicolor]